jgi:hypothetical protein
LEFGTDHEAPVRIDRYSSIWIASGLPVIREQRKSRTRADHFGCADFLLLRCGALDKLIGSTELQLFTLLPTPVPQGPVVCGVLAMKYEEKLVFRLRGGFISTRIADHAERRAE